MIIFKKFTFDSAHFLPNVPDTHRCKNMHGHTYKLTIFIEGNLQKDLGWVMDFGVLKTIVNPIIDQLDHQVLNNIQGLENPTCELLAKWIWNKVKPHVPGLIRVELHETLSSGVIYSGD